MTIPITKSRAYKHLMVLMGNAGILTKEERINTASAVLGRDIESYTQLNMEDVEKMVESFLVWRKIQEERYLNGTLLLESQMIMDMVNDPKRLSLAENEILSTKKSREKFMRETNYHKHKHQEFAKDDMEDFLADVSSSMGIKKRELMVTEGRFPKDMYTSAPTTGFGLATNVGGIPEGAILHLWGGEHSGKSYCAQHMIRNAQREGKKCILLDTEAAGNGNLAYDLGVDIDDLTVFMPRSLNEIGELLKQLSTRPYFIVIDSIASTGASIDINKDLTNSTQQLGSSARLWQSFLPIVRINIKDSGATILFINQVRSKIGASQYEDPDKYYGGSSIRHHIDFSAKVTSVKEKNKTLDSKGYKISRFKVDKNRFGELFTFDVTFKPGEPYNEMVDIVRTCALPVTKGSTVTYGELSKNTICADFVPDTTGKELVSKKNRWSIRIDPLLMTAIRMDDEDFDEVDIESLSQEEFDEIINDPEKHIPDVDEENSEYMALPGGIGEIRAALWLSQHPMASYVISERLLNGINRRHEVVRSLAKL